MDEPVMTDMCQEESPGAAPPGLEGVTAEDLEALQAYFDGNYDDCSEGRDAVPKKPLCALARHKGLGKGDSRKDVALRDQHKLSTVARIEQVNRTDEGYGNVERLGGKIFFRMDDSVTPTILASTIAFLLNVVHSLRLQGLPLLVYLGVTTRQRPSPLRILTDLKVPTLIVIESFIFAGPELVLSLCLEALRRERQGAPFAVFLVTRLLYTVWLVVSFKANGPLLASGFVMMLDRFLLAAFLYTYDAYSKHLVCSPRTLSDLYGLETCVLPTMCQKPSGRSGEDILEACACAYEMVATSEHGEVIQMYHAKYGPHMRNFVRDNALGACVWVFALCLALILVFNVFKVIWDDVPAVSLFYKHYTAEQRTGATRSDAFHAAALRLLAADASLTEPLTVAGPSRIVAERADVQAGESTPAVEARMEAMMQALPTSGQPS